MAASYGPDDEGEVRRSAERCAGKFLDLSSAGHMESAKALAAERPQILVDLMGHTTGARYIRKPLVSVFFSKYSTKALSSQTFTRK